MTLPEPVRNLDVEALRKAGMQAKEISVTLPLDVFLLAWERFERTATSGIVISNPDGQIAKSTKRGQEAFREAYGAVEDAALAAKQRTENVGVRKIQRRPPARRR